MFTDPQKKHPNNCKNIRVTMTLKDDPRFAFYLTYAFYSRTAHTNAVKSMTTLRFMAAEKDLKLKAVNYNQHLYIYNG